MRSVTSISGLGGYPSSHDDAGNDLPRIPSRALVAVDRAMPSARRNPNPGRPAVAFLAQLIATKQGLAQTRTRRRVGVGDALSAYRMIAKSSLRVAPRMWGRSI